MVGGVVCDICGDKKFDNKGLERHKTTHLDKKEISCESCGQLFKSKENMLRHQNVVHTLDALKRFKCSQPNCGRGFNTNQALEGHTNMHLGLKPYVCDQCGDAFQNASNRIAHVKKVHQLKFNN